MYRSANAQSLVEYMLVIGALVLAVMVGLTVLAAKTKRQHETAADVTDKATEGLSGALNLP